MNALLETNLIAPEILAESATIESTATASEPVIEQQPTDEFQLTEAEKQRWIWLFEQLKNANLPLSFSEKVKMFCEASSPEEVEEIIYSRFEEPAIIPLAA